MKARNSGQALAADTGGPKEPKRRAASGALIGQAQSSHNITLRSLERLKRSLLRDVLAGCAFGGTPKGSGLLGIQGKKTVYSIGDLKAIASITRLGILPSSSLRCSLKYCHTVIQGKSLLVQSGHFAAEFQRPLSGVKRTSNGLASMSAYDPKRTCSRC
jgi:hypothetical protein